VLADLDATGEALAGVRRLGNALSGVRFVIGHQLNVDVAKVLVKVPKTGPGIEHVTLVGACSTAFSDGAA
jgi:hypothetical protein